MPGFIDHTQVGRTEHYVFHYGNKASLSQLDESLKASNPSVDSLFQYPMSSSCFATDTQSAAPNPNLRHSNTVAVGGSSTTFARLESSAPAPALPPNARDAPTQGIGACPTPGSGNNGQPVFNTNMGVGASLRPLTQEGAPDLCRSAQASSPSNVTNALGHPKTIRKDPAQTQAAAGPVVAGVSSLLATSKAESTTAHVGVRVLPLPVTSEAQSMAASASADVPSLPVNSQVVPVPATVGGGVPFLPVAHQPASMAGSDGVSTPNIGTTHVRKGGSAPPRLVDDGDSDAGAGSDHSNGPPKKKRKHGSALSEAL